MKKLTRKMVAVTLSMMMLAETIGVVPVAAEETEVQNNLEQELLYSSYPTGDIPMDSSEISDDLKIDSVEEYYISLEEEKKAEEEGGITKAELAAGDVALDETQNEIVELTNGEIIEAEDYAQEAVEVLPDAVDNSTSKFFPVIKNQGLSGSCVAFSQVYYQFTYTMNKHLNRETTEENTFSPYFLYNFFGTDNGKNGLNQVYAYMLMKNKGCLPWDGVSYDNNYADWSPNKENWEEADNYRIKKYELINTNIGLTGNEITSPKDSDLEAIKVALNNGEILTFSTYADQKEAFELKRIEESDTISENNAFKGDLIVTDIKSPVGAHRMTIVGYNDNIWVDINEDKVIQEAEKGAFKVANSWGENWGNDGFCWFSYDAINYYSVAKSQTGTKTSGNYFNNVARIEVADYDSDSDIKLVYTLNTGARNEIDVSMTAQTASGNITSYATPFYVNHVNPFNSYRDTEKLSFSGNQYEEDGTMVMDLDNVIPDLNSENFKDYYWIMDVADNQANNYSCTIKSAKIVDYNTGKTYSVMETLQKTVDGNSNNLTFEKENSKGFDFKINSVSYKNETRNSTTKIVVGDKIKFTANVGNVGDIKSTDNNKMGVLFSVNGINTWSDDYINKQGLLPGRNETLTANGGGLNGDGTISFNEPGTYTVTAWVNDVNDFPNEYGGNNAENNKATYTFTVVEPEVLDVESFNISNENPVVGEELTFEAKLRQPATVQTKLLITYANALPTTKPLYGLDYTDGTTQKFTFTNEGTFDITFYIKDSITGEEKSATWTVTVGPKEETTEVETTTMAEIFEVESFNISNENPLVGEELTFEAKLKQESTVQSKLYITIANALPSTKPYYNPEYTDGTIKNFTFSNEGTYNVTFYVKDVATGVEKSTTWTVTVIPAMKVNSLNTSATEIMEGNSVTFSVGVENATNVNTRLIVADANGVTLDEASVDGTTLSYVFENEGIYRVYAMVKDLDTGKEVASPGTTINVEDRFTVESLDISNENPLVGEELTFEAKLKYPITVQTKLYIINANYVPGIKPYYSIEYKDGAVRNFTFSNEGTYNVTFYVKDVETNEEKSITWTVTVDPKEEPTTEVETTTNTVEEEKYYDFEITELTYVNETTGVVGGEIKPNDKVKFRATIKNIGNGAAPDNLKMGVQFQVDGNTQNITWNDEYVNRAGLAAGESVTLTGIGGTSNTDGSWTFTEAGSHTVTAWVNDTNDFADELGGNQAENNKKTISVTVSETVEEFAIGELTASKTKIKLGDEVTFNINVENASNIQTKIVLSNPYDKYNPIIDETEFVNGTTVSLKITETGLCNAYAIVKNLTTGEERYSNNLALNTYETLGGFDFSVTELNYNNLTTGVYNGTINVGDSIQFGAIVENVGDTKSDTNKKLGVQFQINGNTSNITWCDSFYNTDGLAPYEYVSLWACGGSVNTDGVVTFTQKGTYTITAWVNDTNDYANEVGGNQAANNRKTITITVE